MQRAEGSRHVWESRLTVQRAPCTFKGEGPTVQAFFLGHQGPFKPDVQRFGCTGRLIYKLYVNWVLFRTF